MRFQIALPSMWPILVEFHLMRAKKEESQ